LLQVKKRLLKIVSLDALTGQWGLLLNTAGTKPELGSWLPSFTASLEPKGWVLMSERCADSGCRCPEAGQPVI